MRMSEEFGVDLFELTGDQSGGQEGEGKSEARERTLGSIPFHTILYQTVWYGSTLTPISWYLTVPYRTVPYHIISYHTTPYCTMGKREDETGPARQSIITSL